MKYILYTGLLVALVMSLFLIGCAKQETATPPVTETETKPEKVSCAVCGMEMYVTAMQANMEYEGKTLYFCTENEKAEFEKDPKKYLSGDVKKSM